jgi:hypothetical protein
MIESLFDYYFCVYEINSFLINVEFVSEFKPLTKLSLTIPDTVI